MPYLRAGHSPRRGPMPVVLVFRTDVHASDRNPVSWKGDYPAEIWANLEQIGEIARQAQAQVVLDGGDYFHTKAASRNSHALVVKTAEIHAKYPCPVVAIEGNHDLAYNSLDSLPKQPLGVLYASGVFGGLRDMTYAGSDGVKVRVVGFPYSLSRTVDELRSIRKKPEDQYLVAVVHALASENPAENAADFFREPVFRYRDLVAHDGPDVWCFPPGTPVLDALYQPVPIEQVTFGTALGRGSDPNNILAVHPVRHVEEDLVALDIEGVPPFVQGATSEHPYWVATGMQCVLPSRASRRCHPDRAAAAYPCSSCADAPDVKAGWVKAGDIVAGDYVAIPVPHIPSGTDSCPGLARLLGYYVAEGHILQNREKKPVAGVAWSFHEDEHDLHEDVRALVLEHFGLETSLHPAGGACIQVCAYGREVAEFFATHGGRYSDRKSLSSWIWQCSAIDRLEFLTGWLLGDGHARKVKTEVGGATASVALGFQVFFLALSLGLRPSFTIRPPAKHQNYPCHVISFYGDDGESLSRCLGITPPDRSKTKVAGFFDDGLYYVRVRGVSRVPYKGPVHNFRTSTGEYVVGGVLVHNCFGHWHKDQGIINIDGKLFVNQGAVSRGALIKENTERTPQVAIIEATVSGITARTVPLVVPPATEVFDFERKEKQEREGRDIDQFITRLQQDAAFDLTVSIEDNVRALNFADDVRDLALEYLEAARSETG